MEMHWWCCECNATNSSPDDDHLVCSQENCDHHLCSDCYNPMQIGRERHLNDDAVTTTRITINKSKALVNDAAYEAHKMKKKFRTARRLIGHYARHSKIGRAFLNFWRYVQKKTKRKKDHLRIEGKHLPTIESLPSNSHYWEPEETQYREERYYYQS